MLLFVFTLLATQSKTSVIALIVASVIGVVGLYGSQTASKFMIVLAALAGPSFVAIAYIDRMNPLPLGPLGNLTGRTDVWLITIQQIRNRIVFGLGSDLWGYAMKSQYLNFLGFAPGQSHNEFLQSEGVHGIPGLIGYASLTAILIWAVAKTGDRKSSALLAAMVAFFVFRAVTESILPLGFTDTNVMILAAALGMAHSGLAVPAQNDDTGRMSRFPREKVASSQSGPENENARVHTR
jgi:O-antigen ligase